MSPERQMEVIQNMVRRGTHHWIRASLVLFAGGLLVVGLPTGEPFYFMGSAFVALIAYSAHRTIPHIEAAARAITGGARRAAVIRIEVTEGSDSDTYHAWVPKEGGGHWRFEFIPLGWTPSAGERSATLYLLSDSPWPPLVRVGEGVLYPTSSPSRELRAEGGAS